ncbi:hypothetical protein ACFLZL_02615 [Thermodesulfobacteriota bacterium]
MIFIPKEKPVIQHLNSYYLDIERLIEHYQGELCTGGIHFNSASAEGVVFFDETSIVNVIIQERDELWVGTPARDRLIAALGAGSFSVTLYQIDPDKIFFWANLPNAIDYDQTLIETYTDLESLTQKMISLKLTGYIKASFEAQTEDGFLFISNGVIIGVRFPSDDKKSVGTENDYDRLISASKQAGTIFVVKSIVFDKKLNHGQPEHRILLMIHELMTIFDSLVKKNRKIKIDFYTLLRKKFIENADRYDFLDPFAAEFKFNPDTVEFTGDESPKQLFEGFLACVNELAEDLEIADMLSRNMEGWAKRYSKELKEFGLS